MIKRIKSNCNDRRKAFTLMEVIIAITILSTLSMLVATSLSRALKAKRKIQAEVEDVSALRDTLKVMRADIYQAYNHYDFEKEIFDISQKTTTTTPGQTNNNSFNGQPAQPSAPVTQRENKREDPSTQFVGDDQKINFVTLNNGRTLANELQADFIEVGYALKECKNLTTEKNSQCLFRRVEKIVDRDVTKGGSESVLLENIKEFKLRYIGDGKKDWVKEWKSTGGLDDSTKSIFPDAVEITLAIEREMDSKKKEYSLQYVVPIHNPNNSKSKNNNASGNTFSPNSPNTFPGGNPPPPGI